MKMRKTVYAAVPLLIVVGFASHVLQTRNVNGQVGTYRVTRTPAAKSDVMSRDLREFRPIAPRAGGNPQEAERVRLLNLQRRRIRAPSRPTPQVSFNQNQAGPPATTELVSVFEGIGKDLPFSYSSSDKFRVRTAPPDTNGAVGATQYVQWVNTSFAVFEKETGRVLYGPTQGQTLWQNFDGGSCENTNDGDPIVQYDKINKRWILAQFSVNEYKDLNTNQIVKVPPYSQCIAVSETSDALGKYRRFRFSYDFFNDFPKMGVWLDGYYTTFNMFGGDDVGALVCAYDKDVMLGLNTERTASQQCVQLPSAYSSLLPADIDGTNLPSAGTPNYLLNLDPYTASINLWKFHVDWNNEANSTFRGPEVISGVEPFEVPCANRERGDCIRQRGTDQPLESLSDRMAYRLAYRRFANYESLVFNHIVATSSGAAAIRWYEMRSPFDVPTIYQSGTYAPDANNRWLASIAMDKLGNIGLGYTVSGSGMSPSIYFAGRNISDKTKGRLQKETLIVSGRSQRCLLANGKCAAGCLLENGECITELARWGDYSSLSIDPSDDCTMWYTAQYLKEDGGYNWNTKIAKIKFNSCR